MSYREFDEAVSALATRLGGLGLTTGAVVGLQLPNTVEMTVALLAVARAGFVAAALPLLWRGAEAVRALRRIGAQALIVCSRVGDANHADMALHVAAEVFAIRFVCAFGISVPDGVVPLDDIWTETAAATKRGPLPRTGNDQALITFDSGPDGPTPVWRTHAELLVGGLAVTQEAGLPRHATILGTMVASSFATLSATFAAWLLTGGVLVLLQPFDAGRLTAQLGETPCDAIVLPGPLVAPLADAKVIGAASSLARVIAVWRSPERQSASPRWSASAPLIDVLAFGEIGIAPLRRAIDGSPSVMKLGHMAAPSNRAGGAAVATISRTSAGTLALGGPMVPASLRAPEADRRPAAEIDTGYPCRVDPETEALTLTGSPAGIISIGGYRFALRELQDMVGRVEAESVLAALPDLLAGQKLAGRATDADAMCDALAQLGINPLVGEAFRDRRRAGRAPAA